MLRGLMRRSKLLGIIPEASWIIIFATTTVGLMGDFNIT